MPRTDLRLRLHVRGESLDPGALTTAIGVQPTRAFGVGEATGKYAKTVAGWDWESSETGPDLEPLVKEMLDVLGEKASAFADAVRLGAKVAVIASGEVLGVLVTSDAEAEAVGYSADGDLPFIAATRPVIYLSERATGFLAAARASFEVYLDFDSDDREQDRRSS